MWSEPWAIPEDDREVTLSTDLTGSLIRIQTTLASSQQPLEGLKLVFIEEIDLTVYLPFYDHFLLVLSSHTIT
jgi:hypothetical protein